MLLSVFVGAGAGLLALLTDRSILFKRGRVFLPLSEFGGALPDRWLFLPFVARPLLLALVLVLVAYVVRRLVPEAQGSGIGHLMSAIGRRGGFLRKRLIILKPLLTTLCIGAGAPLGLEGPVVQTGAALGSLAGRRFKMGMSNLRILAAAGAAAAAHAHHAGEPLREPRGRPRGASAIDRQGRRSGFARTAGRQLQAAWHG